MRSTMLILVTISLGVKSLLAGLSPGVSGRLHAVHAALAAWCTGGWRRRGGDGWNLLRGVLRLLLRSCLESEEITALYAAYGGELWRALLVVSGGRADVAKEAMAEAFARLVERRSVVREPRGWLYRTGYRVVVDQLRRERRVSGEVSGDAAAPSGAALSSELVAALARLSPGQRLVVFLTYVVGMSLREVADVTGSPVATVKVRLHRARKALRVALEEAEVGA